MAGDRVAFIRARDGFTSTGDLWVADLETGSEVCIASADALTTGGASMPEAEQARRERLRQTDSGFTSFDTADDGTVVAALAGRLVVVDGEARRRSDDSSEPARVWELPSPAVDPRITAGGESVAWQAAGALWWAPRAGGPPRRLSPDDGATWGLADFIAAEELGRYRGHWWAPDGQAVLAARVDDSGVAKWWLADPSDPAAAPRAIRYPAAGTANADVSLWLLPLEGPPARIFGSTDDPSLHYIAGVRWQGGSPLVQTLSRCQRHTTVWSVDGQAAPRRVAGWSDDSWVDVIPGAPAWFDDGSLATVRRDAARDRLRLYADGEPVSPADVHIRSLAGLVTRGAVVTAARTPEESAVGVVARGEGLEWLTAETGWWQASAARNCVVVTGAGSTDQAWRTLVTRWEDDSAHDSRELRSRAHIPGPATTPPLRRAGRSRYALVLPHDTGDRSLPVLLQPYGGPHSQRVVAAAPAYREARWWAEQGFAVLIADGRGTPGVSCEYERGVRHDLAGPVLADQLAALDDALARNDLLDPDRVGISGWSFGGYLAALAVLTRPDRFHVAVAGAPVTDWRLYDTAYTERYLGDPTADDDPYFASGLVERAGELQRPLLFIHGLADDNVVAAHSLRLSSALTAAGRPHTFLPLSGVSHFTADPWMAARITELELDFLGRHLGATPAPSTPDL